MNKAKYAFFILAIGGFGLYMGARSGSYDYMERFPANSRGEQEALLHKISFQKKGQDKFLSITGREDESLCQIFRDADNVEVILTADGVAIPHAGEIQIKSTISCNTTDAKPIFLGSFCPPSSLVQTKNTQVEGVDFSFLNILDFFPRDWYLSHVIVNTPDGPIEKKPSADEMALNLFTFSCEDLK